MLACQSQAAPTPATAPEPAEAAAASRPPSVSGAEEWRGEKYTCGALLAPAGGCPCSHLSADVERGSGTCAAQYTSELPKNRFPLGIFTINQSLKR